MENNNTNSDAAQYDFDFFVIGGGSGGLRAAKVASKLGVRVALADYVVPTPIGTKWGLGGTCVNVGCVPKKLFHFAAQLGHAKEDLQCSGWKVDTNAPHDWQAMVDEVTHHIKQLNWSSKLTLTDLKIKYFNMMAKFVDAHTLELTDPKKNKTERVTAKYILVAVGGRPNYPDNLPNAKELCITSDDIFYQKKAPGKTLIVGGSYIALETAGFLTSFGYDVTVLVRSQILRSYDQQMAKKVGQYMEMVGTKFSYGALLEKVEKGEGEKRKCTIKEKDGSIRTEEFDTVFLAVGRTAETKYLDLNAAGIKSEDESKKIHTNEKDQTNIPNIFCVGDCAVGRPELTPPAVHAGQLLAHRLFAGSEELMDYDMIATTFFTPLEYGCIGFSEEKAIEKFGKDKIAAYHSTFKPLEWTFNKKHPEDICYIKLVCRADQKERIIGLHYLGPNAGEITQGFSLGINMGATKQDLYRTIGIHPTCAEELLSVDITTDKEPTVTEGCKGCGLCISPHL